MECAIDEFSRHDYRSASVSSIVARAGIAKGSLYQYFENKSDLYQYLLDLVMQKKAEFMANAISIDQNQDVFETLHLLFSRMAAFEVQFPDLARIGYRALNGTSPLPEEIINKGRLATRDLFIQLIETGKKNGSIRPDVDAIAAGYIITAAITELGSFLIHHGKKNEDNAVPALYPADIKSEYHQIVSILKDGLGIRSVK